MVYRDLPVPMFVRTCPNGVTALQTSFLNRLSRNFTQCSQISSLAVVRKWASQVTCNPPPPNPNRELLPPETASPLYRLHFLTDCHETSHMCSQTSSLVGVRKWASQVPCNPPHLIGGFCPPPPTLKIQIPLILMKFKPYVLATK